MDRGEALRKEVESLLQASEFEVVDVQASGSSRGLVVRILLDKPGGVSLEDCARVSRAVGDHFEERDVLGGRYVLEVSSPGVERPLRRERDFRRFAGERAQIATYEKLADRHKHTGTLGGFDPDRDAVLLRTEDGQELAIPLGAIRKAKLIRDPWVKPEPASDA